jgi:hypothetical protein
LKIYDKTGVELLDVNVTDNSYRFRDIMQSPELTLYFSKNGFVDVPVDSYADFQGERFYLFDKSNFKKNSTKDYEYTLILHGIAEKLTRFKFYDFANGGYIFPLTAKPIDHVQMIVNVLNVKDAGWTVGTVVDSSEIVLNYSHNNCLEALGMICDEAETEFEITSGKVINVRKTEYNKEAPLALAYGQGNGLKPGIERKNDEKSRPVERLMVQGGTRNIDYSVYGSKYLLLPLSQTLVYNGRTYVTDAEGLYIQRGDKAIETGQEDSLDASTIYPSRVCVVTGVVVVDTEKNLYNVVDSTIPESLDFEESRIVGEKMTVVFQDGMLAGKEFEISRYTHDGRVFELVPTKIDGFDMPGGVYIPGNGNTFVVYGCSLPPAYICDDPTKTGASWDMFREAVEYMYEHEDEKYSYGGQISPIWLKEEWATVSGKIKLGGYCSLTDPELDGVLIRIRSIKDMVNNPFDLTVDLSNALVKPSFSTVLAKLNAYTASLTVQQLTEIRNSLISSGVDVTALTQYLANIYNLSYEDILNYLNSISINAPGNSETKLISGTVIWREGMTYDTTNFKYKILGVSYEAMATALTLDDSDAVYDRIDVFYLDTFGNVNVKTGTPSATPTQPILTETELFVTSAYVAANALQPSGIVTETIYDELAVDEWEPTPSADAGKTTVTDNSIVDPYVGTKHIKASIAVPVETIIYPPHTIGEEYQGGVIFWIDPASGGKKGLIAAKIDTVTDVFWSRRSGYATYSTNGRDAGIGFGQSNSAAMLATPAAAAQAIKYVDELIIDGYDDWFMPSEKELAEMYSRRYQIGNFNPSRDYWSSTEVTWDTARMIHWADGTVYTRDKNERRNVRAIRKFDDTTLPDSSSVSSYAPLDTNIVFSTPAEKNAVDGILSFQMKTSKAWNENTLLIIETYSGAVRTGKCALGTRTNLFGFNPAQIESYQLVAISYNNFSLSQTKFDAIKISLSGSWPNNMDLFIDSIRYQSTTVLQKRETGTVLQIQDQVLIAENWVADGDIYRYTWESAKITENSIVDVVPSNEYMDVVNAAVILPETESDSGYVKLYSKNAPTANIGVTINIMEATL